LISETTLVTVGVTTYNSGEYLLATLESVKAQEYKNIELIISDDGSTDSTIEIAGEWLAVPLNRARFASSRLITVIENTGVSANCNRIIAAAKSEWIKFIAGDDILLPNCITNNMSYVAANVDTWVVFSQVKLYNEQFTEAGFVRDIPAAYPNNLMHPQYTAHDQFELLLLSDRINYTPSYFFHKQLLLAVGGYEEDNSRIEDYPMWLKLTNGGYKLHYFHKPTVGYRMHAGALNNNAWQGIINPNYKVIHQMRQKVAHPHLPWELAAKENFVFYVAKLFLWLNFRHKMGLIKQLYRLIAYYLNPFTYIHYIKKKLPGGHRNHHFYKHGPSA
jgi:glycosyltransferase involved in cell wall biosynthesis